MNNVFSVKTFLRMNAFDVVSNFRGEILWRRVGGNLKLWNIISRAL